MFSNFIFISESGNLSAWLKYHDEHFRPINKILNESLGQEFVYLRNRLKINAELITQWDMWQPCEVCGRPNNEGIKRKTGYCRIKLRRQSGASTDDYDDEEIFFSKLDAISCRSQKLSKRFPGKFYRINYTRFPTTFGRSHISEAVQLIIMKLAVINSRKCTYYTKTTSLCLISVYVTPILEWDKMATFKFVN